MITANKLFRKHVATIRVG